MKKLLNQAATHTHMGTPTARFIAEAERDHIYGQTKRKNQNSTLKMQKLIFLLMIRTGLQLIQRGHRAPSLI
jgi:hypothetical protein